ncbi:hypothetical protein, partial [Streptomyces diastaticus]
MPHMLTAEDEHAVTENKKVVGARPQKRGQPAEKKFRGGPKKPKKQRKKKKKSQREKWCFI